MNRYLVDTTSLIDFSKSAEPQTSRLLALIEAGEEVGTCAVPVAEFYTGLSPEDTLIAAVARAVGATIITENAKDYPMTDVKLLSLREPRTAG
ncbi:MAG: hypothetical protein ACR2PL_01930 [Dehalococcoidia bacterium]